MERYTIMYPRGQPGLPNDPVMAYVNDLRATHTSLSSVTARKAPSTWARDPTRDHFVCVASTSRNSIDPETAPRHHATDAQRRAHLDELAEARCQLFEELAKFHWELGEKHELRNRQPALLPAPR
jgi:hypothetical protein